jgi:hypothetical protein
MIKIQTIRRTLTFHRKRWRALKFPTGVHHVHSGSAGVLLEIHNAIPPSRKMPQRNSPVLDPVRDFIDQILIDDQKAPRKQRHTAHRIYERLCADFSNHPIAERTAREYVQFWKLDHGKAGGEIFIPQA